MASQYPRNRITRGGYNLLAESIATKKQLIFTKVVIGDGDDKGQDINTMATVLSHKMTLPVIDGRKDGDGQYLVQATLSNNEVETGFFPKEVALFAKIDGGTEIMYSYTNGGNMVGFIPDKNTPIDSEIYNIRTKIGNAENVTFSHVDSTYVTAGQLEEHNTDPNAHGGLMTKVKNEVKVATDALATHNTDNDAHAAKFAKYLPLTGGNMSGDITINTHLVDYIIEEGSNGRNWYAKWKSGRMEQFVIVNRYGTSNDTGNISGCIITLMQPFKNTDYIAIPINEMNGARNIWENANSASITSGTGFTNSAYNQSKRTTTSVTVATDKFCDAGVYCVGRWK